MRKPTHHTANKALTVILRISPFLMIAGFLLFFWKTGNRFTVENILHYTPKSYFWAVVFLLFLYAAKSVSVFLPITVLFIACGTIFSAAAALAVNFAGLIVCLTVPYCIGYAYGSDLTEKLVAKHPRLQFVITKLNNNRFFLTYFMRVVSFLPGDLVSMYFGSQRESYWKYLAASILGSLPGTVCATLIGTSIHDPSSPTFILSLIFNILLSVLSLLIYRQINRWKDKREDI